jgi:hypothetical protein
MRLHLEHVNVEGINWPIMKSKGDILDGAVEFLFPKQIISKLR